MSTTRLRSILQRTVGQGYFPHQPAFLIDNPVRRLRSLYGVLRPAGTLVFHEHRPDPDFSTLQTLRTRVEGEGFAFLQSFGSSWNYTATFRKPSAPDECPPRS